ncbi:4Fe-4S dicluster domain-containing protein [Natranaerobius thermophilus]|uniref:Hydrogenase large subunit domain protein n=1 Tax=Natranaerobius thermophilus (strain ATCC BAA-1301 / DSM 18059 / JW/NM-WN-LF) TaxID=457570 RepID=B2A8A3_NATTJ|nr:4Fe-4S dicluster domain-containing protein [Natranaerobius thermophilus]ACB84469.1 hydrogenase large subunit domain protein [Natranaerobius thermophilus JW/NM-WN-LF]
MRKFETEVQKINHEIMRELAKLVFKNKLLDEINELPQKIIQGDEARYRCCVYKERAIITERVRLDMGVNPNNIHSNTFLKDDYEQACHRLDKPVVQALEKACDKCPINRFTVTEACRGCVAHYCMESCPKDAISFINRQAYINQEKCIECGKCKNMCPFNAISDVMRPCRSACTVDAVKVDGDRRISIDQDKCVSCGACIEACPFGAIASKSNFISFLEDLTGGEQIHAMIAPSIAGQFGAKVKVSQIKAALKNLGMDSVQEVAKGADVVAYHEAKELISSIHEHNFMLSSCCPAFVSLVKNFYSEFTANLSQTVSPMIAMGRSIKQKYPGSKVVFIGPCIAKKDEALEEDVQDGVDYVLTYEEICALFEGAGVDPSQCEEFTEEEDQNKLVSPFGRCFAKSGGVGEAIKRTVKEIEPDYDIDINVVKCSGLNECKQVLEKLKNGKLEADFIEGMGCEEGCIGGPGNLVKPNKSKVMVEKYGKEAEIESAVESASSQIEEPQLFREH